MDSTKSDSNLKKENEECVLISWSDWRDLEAGVECVKKVGEGLDKSSNNTDRLTIRSEYLRTRTSVNSAFDWPVQTKDVKNSVCEDFGKNQSKVIKPLSGVIFNSALEQEIMMMFEKIVSTAIDEMVKEDLIQNEVVFWKMLTEVIQEAEKDSIEQHSKFDRIEDSYKTTPNTMEADFNVSDERKCNKERNRIKLQQMLTAAMDEACEEFGAEYTIETGYGDNKAEQIFDESNEVILNLNETRKTRHNELDQEGTSMEKCVTDIEPAAFVKVQGDKKQSQKESTLQVDSSSSFLQKGGGTKDHSDAEKELRNATRQYVQDIIMVSLQMVRRENEKKRGDSVSVDHYSRVSTEHAEAVEQNRQPLNQLKPLSEGDNKTTATDDMHGSFKENLGRWKRFRNRLRKMRLWRK